MIKQYFELEMLRKLFHLALLLTFFLVSWFEAVELQIQAHTQERHLNLQTIKNNFITYINNHANIGIVFLNFELRELLLALNLSKLDSYALVSDGVEVLGLGRH